VRKLHGEYVGIPFEGKVLWFVRCPYCGHMTYIPGKKKIHKVHVCYGCDCKFLEG